MKGYFFFAAGFFAAAFLAAGFLAAGFLAGAAFFTVFLAVAMMCLLVGFGSGSDTDEDLGRGPRGHRAFALRERQHPRAPSLGKHWMRETARISLARPIVSEFQLRF
jgi:hypothetical protein